MKSSEKMFDSAETFSLNYRIIDIAKERNVALCFTHAEIFALYLFRQDICRSVIVHKAAILL